MPLSIPVRRPGAVTLVSVLLHGAALAALLAVSAAVKVKVVSPVTTQRWVAALEVEGAARSAKVPEFDRPSTGASLRKDRAPSEAPKTATPVRPAHAARASSGAKAAPESKASVLAAGTQGNGNDAENAMPAFPTFSPRPPVRDRALLPGSEQQVVVDVSLNAAGEVLDEKLIRGVGNPLDQLVLDTVKTWRFHPATVNGTAIASEAEVIIPFGPGSPIADA